MPESATWAGVATAFGIAALIAGIAWRSGSLSKSGLLAAILVGGTAMSAGSSWGRFLVFWFVSASLASRIGRRQKERATADVVAKGGQRDAAQVLANGGIYALCAVGALVLPAQAALLAMVGVGALVAAGADTLATETGTLWRGRPWSLRTGGLVPTGSSGAVSLPGTLGMVLGAWLLALTSQFTGLIPADRVFHVTLAGIAGATADTLVGAWWQARRWCPTCERETEQTVHQCGTTTQPWRGLPWLDNDRVNFLCTAVGAATVLLLGA